jgi:FG-GAP-like repeat
LNEQISSSEGAIVHKPNRCAGWYILPLLGLLLLPSEVWSQAPSQSQAQNFDRLRSFVGSAAPPGIHRLGVQNFSAPSGAHLTYYGGRVVTNMQVVIVLWTSSVNTILQQTGTPSLMTFYQQMLGNGSYTAWLNREYNTIGQASNQVIGPGGVVGPGPITITPSVNGTTITDTQIQTELAAQISAGHLPAPTMDAAGNNNTYYAVYFPPGKTISMGGINSCVNGGFCAYHGTSFTSDNHEIYYGVFPDMFTGGCATGCGTSSSPFNNYTAVATHEMSETITDAEVGIAGASLGPPLAWYDGTNGEMADICDPQQGTYAAYDGHTYTIQLLFSNAQNNCISIPAGFTPTYSHDFNHDGKSDVLWRDTSGNVAIWQMNGTSISNLATSFVSQVPIAWSIAGTGDFNGDGKSDILWHDTSGNFSIWEMNGTTILNQATSFVANVPTVWSIAGTGDFNGDGKSDVLWHDTSGNVAILEMNGTTILNQATSFVGQVPTVWSIVGSGDFNGDGKSDIVWYNGGYVAILEMNGTTILNQATSFVGQAPTVWSIQDPQGN